jgi:prepilin-type N-terminal cleavage/methylation domain-containing protein/prepilin-type processing-associated H-X9-DG protein
MNHARRHAFSLTELLVVVAVIALLAAILVPVLTRARERTQLAVCTDNLGKIAKGVLQCAQKNNQTLPQMENKAPGGWWWYKDQVKSFIAPQAEANKVFACPSDRGYGTIEEPAIPFCADAKHNFTSYIFNGVNLPGTPNIGGRTLDSINQPARTLLVMEWTAHAPLSWHDSHTGRANAPFYCDAQSVVAFVDGHVKFIKIYYDGMNPAYSRDPIPGYEYKFSAE